MEGFLQIFAGVKETYVDVYIGFLRYAAPILAGLLLLRCCWPLLTFRRQPEIWAWLLTDDGGRIPVTHWENVAGGYLHGCIIAQATQPWQCEKIS